jgi:uncharacterized protein YcfJ
MEFYMVRLSHFTAALFASALFTAPSAFAEHYGYGQARNTACEKQKQGDKAKGIVVGALLGAVAGGAIGNQVEDDYDDRGRYGRYDRYGRYGRYDRYNHHRHNGNDDGDGEVIAGALLGAVAGGLIGSAVADNNSGNCEVAGQFYPSGYPEGQIPRTTEGLYGRPGETGSRYPESAPRSYPISQPSYPNDRDYGRDECRTIYRETRMPDGRVDREPVTACRDGYNGGWRVQGDAQTRSDEELFGY